MVPTRAEAYSSYRLRGTSSRVGALQACPLMKAMIGPSEAIATSRSTSSSRIAADFPPSSRVQCFIWAAQSSFTRLPAGTLPGD
jgi:hypothetical protein